MASLAFVSPSHLRANQTLSTSFTSSLLGYLSNAPSNVTGYDSLPVSPAGECFTITPPNGTTVGVCVTPSPATSAALPESHFNVALIAGISVGAGAFLLILVGCFCLWRRRRKARRIVIVPSS